MRPDASVYEAIIGSGIGFHLLDTKPLNAHLLADVSLVGTLGKSFKQKQESTSKIIYLKCHLWNGDPFCLASMSLIAALQDS